MRQYSYLSTISLLSSTVIPLFVKAPATTALFTLSLHDALPISELAQLQSTIQEQERHKAELQAELNRSEEHTSELQSRFDLVCRLLLEKKSITGYDKSQQ